MGRGTKIKICGLTHMEDITSVNAVNPDYVGFVFATSKRMVTPSMAEMMKRKLNPGIQTVGVFVNEPVDNVIHILQRGVVDIAQLHGDETEEEIQLIQNATGKQVVKAVEVTSETDLRKWNHSKADFLILDQGKGSGETFDWSLIGQITHPFFLAGGLKEENIYQAIEQVQPYGVDVSSGVETDGKKDPEKMEEFVALVRRI